MHALYMPPVGGAICQNNCQTTHKGVDIGVGKLNLSGVGLLPSLRSRQTSRVSSFYAHGRERFSQGVSI